MSNVSGIRLTWTAPTGTPAAARYEIDHSEDGNDPWTPLTNNLTSTGHTHSNVGYGVTRHYRVRAVNATMLISPWSDSDSATAIREALAAPGDPTGLSAAVSNVSDILLSWTAATDGVPNARYEIEYSADGSTDWRPLANNVAATATGYTDNGADYGETRHYRVRAVNTEGLEGEWSDTANATTENPKPGVPTNVMAVARASPASSFRGTRRPPTRANR